MNLSWCGIETLCDTCIYDDDMGCCTAEDCFGGDHYDNQNTLFEPQENEEISDHNMKMWEEIFKAERMDKE